MVALGTVDPLARVRFPATALSFTKCQKLKISERHQKPMVFEGIEPKEAQHKAARARSFSPIAPRKI